MSQESVRNPPALRFPRGNKLIRIGTAGGLGGFVFLNFAPILHGATIPQANAECRSTIGGIFQAVLLIVGLACAARLAWNRYRKSHD